MAYNTEWLAQPYRSSILLLRKHVAMTQQTWVLYASNATECSVCVFANLSKQNKYPHHVHFSLYSIGKNSFGRPAGLGDLWSARTKRSLLTKSARLVGALVLTLLRTFHVAYYIADYPDKSRGPWTNASRWGTAFSSIVFSDGSPRERFKKWAISRKH